MPPKSLKKESKAQKGSKWQKKANKTTKKRPLELQQMSDSDDIELSESRLDTPGPMQAGSKVEEAGEASQRPPATQATQATQ